MTLLQKKCLVASSGVHGLLLLVAVVLAVFHSEPAVTEEQVLTIISPRILDRAGSGGEAPPAVTQQTAISQPQQQPAPVAPPSHPTPPAEPPPQPRAVEPVKVASVPEPKPKVEKVAPEKNPTFTSTSAKPSATKTHEVVADLSRTTRITSSAKPSNAATSTARASTDARSEEIAKMLSDWGSHIRNSGAKATVVTVPGEGGGEAFVGYETAIYNAYHRAWKAPDEVTEAVVTDVKIVVARDGSVISAEIISPAGVSAMDRSIQRALDAVKQLPAFPEGAQDAQRTFRIRFNLEAKQSAG